MIGQFAAGAGKKAGEFYTPQEVSQILAEIVITGKQRLKTVYDPTCGSGSLLLRTARSGQADEIFGQEKNPTTFNLCRMNMLLHGIKYNDFDIRNGDTLEADEFGDQQFDAVVANRPSRPIGVPPRNSTTTTGSARPECLPQNRRPTMRLSCT